MNALDREAHLKAINEPKLRHLPDGGVEQVSCCAGGDKGGDPVEWDRLEFLRQINSPRFRFNGDGGIVERLR